jgi:D-3-phosphoglycerate dehydrogenase / 2-oxoglutarate reductase
MVKILISDSISDSALTILKQSGVDFDYKPDLDSQGLLQVIGAYDALIVRSRTKATRQLIEKGAKLKVIGRAGVGLDNIDLEAAKEKGIKIVSTPDALTNAVAEFTIGLMIALARSLVYADRSTHDGKWVKNSLMGSELKGKTYGTIGIGRIGAKVSELAHSFGMRIMANDVIPVPQPLVDKFQITVTSQNEIFSRADYVDLHVPLTDETIHLVNYDKLCMMKKTAFIINTSRGKVVREKDLIRALDENRLAGAALDVFETEPLAQSELQKNARVLLTPHIAGQTEEAQHEAGRLVAELVLQNLRLIAPA